MPLLSGITSFFDKYILGYAIGTAAGPSLEPFVQDLANEAWRLNQVVPLDPEVAAAVAAERVDDYDRMKDQAAQHGIGETAFADLYGEALNAPGMGELFQMWRRALIGDADFTHGLRKAKLEDRWTAPLQALRDVLLSSEELAMLQQQGFIDPARANEEGGLQGVTPERQQLRFEASGLPPGHSEAQQMLNRGLIGPAEFAVMIREGHTKTKYTDVLQQNARRWLSAIEWVDAHLRGHATEAEMYAGTKAQGVTRADTDVLFNSHGRALTTHQITTGLARGGVFDGPTDQIPEAYLASLKQGSIQPRYYNLDYANRYSYFSDFFIRLLLQANTITAQRATELWIEAGRPPDLAKEVADALAGGPTAKGDTHLSKADTQLWTRTHSSYLGALIPQSDVTAAFNTLGIPAADQAKILAVWDQERALRRKGLSSANIHKAYVKSAINDATGVPWTRDEAINELVLLGWDQGEAGQYLDIP